MIVRYSTDALRKAYTHVDNRFILDYLPNASGFAVQAYLYGLLLCGAPGVSDASIADELGASETDVLAAFSYWQEQKLVRIVSENPLTVEYLALAAEDAAETVVPGQYANLVSALNTLIAPRRLDYRELRHVFDWIEVYGLDEGCVLELVSHCMGDKGRRISVNYMTRVAETWSEAGVRTRAEAREHLAGYELGKHGATAILRQWNKRRKPTKDEMALYDKWTSAWGFAPDAILAALPKLTVSGAPNFVYLDELLDGLRTGKRVEAADIARIEAEEDADRAFAKRIFTAAGKVEPATRTQRAQITMFRREFGMADELLLFGAEQCRGANEPFGMMKKLWNDWRAQGVTSVEDARAATAQKAAIPKRGSRRQDYAQHNLSDEQLEKLLVDLDKDL